MDDTTRNPAGLSLDELVELLATELDAKEPGDAGPEPQPDLVAVKGWEVRWTAPPDQDGTPVTGEITSVTVQVQAATVAAALEAAVGVSRAWLETRPGVACAVTAVTAVTV
jgi:hypothetical protein